MISARLPLPHLLVRGVDTEIACPLHRGRDTIAPLEGDVVVTGPSGIVASGPAVVETGIATFVVQGADTALHRLADRGWAVQWSLTVAETTERIRPLATAALVRTRLHPVVTTGDLYRRVPALDPTNLGKVTRDNTGHQWSIEEAWTEIEGRLIEQGRRPWLVMSPGSLRQVHLNLTLALVFEDLATRLAEPYEVRAAQYRAAYEDAWSRLVFEYDADRDGKADSVQRSGAGTLWTSGRS